MFAGWLSTKISRILGLRELIDIPLLNKRLCYTMKKADLILWGPAISPGFLP
jgi:hypothetical protein